jgi:predicted CopG family antitoxin
MPTTITVSKETKELLAKLKGDKTWDKFLFELVENYRRERAKKALEELRKIEFDSSYEEVRLKLRLGES